jgi:8-oxo-dGTP pyrophosphatase MutT (NUDIX family)
MAQHLAPDERSSLARDLLLLLLSAAPEENGGAGRPIGFHGRYDGEAATAYAQALVDGLAFIGALAIEDDTIRVVSVQARYLLLLILELLDGGSLVADWHGHGVDPTSPSPLSKSVNLLRALDLRRLELLPDSLPVRETRAAIGLIVRREDTEGYQLLLYWDARASSWQFLGGRIEADDASPRAAMLRELAEELQLAALDEEAVELVDLGPPFSETRLSPTFGLLTRTLFYPFGVVFRTEIPVLPGDVRWFSQAEVEADQSLGGEMISGAPLRYLGDKQGFSLDQLLA